MYFKQVKYQLIIYKQIMSQGILKKGDTANCRKHLEDHK